MRTLASERKRLRRAALVGDTAPDRGTGMSRLLAAVFKDEAGARAGAEALRLLHADGAITLYAMAVVLRDPRGRALHILEPMNELEGAAAPAVGAALGALVSLLGGPATAAARSVETGLVGAIRDLFESGLDPGFLERFSSRMRAGTGAVVADVEEERLFRLETCVAALGGSLLRHGHGGAVPEELVTREVEALLKELARLRKERAESEHAVAARAVRQARSAELRRSLRRARLLAGGLRREAAAKVAVLRMQAEQLEGDARTAVARRAEIVRTGLEARALHLHDLLDDVVQPPRPRRRPGRHHHDPSGEL